MVLGADGPVPLSHALWLVVVLASPTATAPNSASTMMSIHRGEITVYCGGSLEVGSA